MKSKIKAIIFTAILVVSIGTATMPLASAADPNTLTIEDVTVAKDDSVTVPIEILNATDVSAVDMYLRFNRSVLNVTSATMGEFTSGFIPNFDNIESGELFISTYRSVSPPEDLTGDVIVGYVTLKAEGEELATSPLNVTYSALADMYGVDVYPRNTHNGTFNITAGPDTTPPAAISDLATSEPTDHSITLTWTAPGADGNTGTAETYDIRYSTSEITEGNWNSATQCEEEPAPQEAESSETFPVTGLSSDTTYYFAIKTADEVPLWSDISNSPSGTTTADETKPTIGVVSPEDGATKVSRTTTISATFSEAMNTTSVHDAFSITPYVLGAFSWDDGTMMTFEPDEKLASKTTYTVTISTKAEDLAGNNLEYNNTWAFTTKRKTTGGGGTPRDTDNDGYTDIQEMLADTDENDPCDPDPECAACIATKPAATPTPTPTPTAEPTAIPTPEPTAEPAAEPTPTEEPGFEAVFAIAGLLAVAYLVLRRKSK